MPVLNFFKANGRLLGVVGMGFVLTFVICTATAMGAAELRGIHLAASNSSGIFGSTSYAGITTLNFTTPSMTPSTTRGIPSGTLLPENHSPASSRGIYVPPESSLVRRGLVSLFCNTFSSWLASLPPRSRWQDS